MTIIEPDQDFSLAGQQPRGFAFDTDAQTLNVVEAEAFPEDIQRDVDGLMWLGYLSDSFELFGHQFTIRTLTRGERLAITQLTKEYEETLGMADAYSTAIVAASLMVIDGRPLADLQPGKSAISRIRENFDLVQKWYDPVIEALYERVGQLTVRQQVAFVELQSK